MTAKFTGRSSYSRWDGTQKFRRPSADEVLAAISDDLVEYGDLQQALRHLLQRGMKGRDGGQIPGLRDLLGRLRDQRQSQLERFNLDTVLDGIRRQLEEIVQLERDAIRDWLQGPKQAGPKQTAEKPEPDEQTDEDATATGAAAEETPDGDFSERVLADIGRRNQAFMDGLPEEVAARVGALKQYEFLSPEAQRKFLKLLRELGRNVATTFFRNAERLVQNLSDADLQRLQEMLAALNELLVNKISGEDADFDDFMRKFGDLFGEQPPASLDELLRQMREQLAASQALLNSLSPEEQEQLAGLLNEKFGDTGLRRELLRLAKGLDFLDSGKRYRFAGREPLELQTAMELMRRLAELDKLEQQLQQAQYDGALAALEPATLRELLGEDAGEALEEMRELLKSLEQAGYVQRDGDSPVLTPRGTRALERKILGEIYRLLGNRQPGGHNAREEGRFGDRMEEAGRYEYGDPFQLHMPRTLRNALERRGPGTPVPLHPDDFEVYRSEQPARTATVLMLDLSWSMALRGAFQSAKKVALALHSLISTSYPRDSLYVLGFSAYAREIKPQDLPCLQYDDYLLGTNMQHALQLAEKLLTRHPESGRQIIMITDGEPTAHLEGGRPVFAYPPTAATFRRTLQAVRACTRKRITINTFMLDESEYLNSFIRQLHRLNSGRVFSTTPGQLGEFLLTDYMRHRQTRLGGGFR